MATLQVVGTKHLETLALAVEIRLLARLRRSTGRALRKATATSRAARQPGKMRAKRQRSRKKAGNRDPLSKLRFQGFANGCTPFVTVGRRAIYGRASQSSRAAGDAWESMTDQRDSLAREIDEELRREQLLKLWERYGTYVIAAVVVIIAGIGGYKYYEHRRTQAAETAGARFTTAAREAAQDKKAEAQKALEEVARTAPAGYSALARLRLAAAEREAGKTAQAATAFEAIAKESGLDPLLADYAQLQAAMLRLDSASWTEMQNRLNDLAAESNPWRFSARELLALAAQKAGKADEARTQYQRLLSDRNTPPSIGGRARMMMAMLTEAELANASPAVVPAPEPKAPVVDDKPKAKAPGKASK